MLAAPETCRHNDCGRVSRRSPRPQVPVWFDGHRKVDAPNMPPHRHFRKPQISLLSLSSSRLAVPVAKRPQTFRALLRFASRTLGAAEMPCRRKRRLGVTSGQVRQSLNAVAGGYEYPAFGLRLVSGLVAAALYQGGKARVMT